MMKFIQIGVLALVFAASQVLAQDLDKGYAALGAGDYETGMKELRPLAEQGDHRVQGTVGMMYSNGWGVPQDDIEAAKWWKLSAEQGNFMAQFLLGESFREGTGVPQDYQTAHMWFNIAIANGAKDATVARDLTESKMTPTAIEEAQRRARECMGSDYQKCD